MGLGPFFGGKGKREGRGAKGKVPMPSRDFICGKWISAGVGSTTAQPPGARSSMYVGDLARSYGTMFVRTGRFVGPRVYKTDRLKVRCFSRVKFLDDAAGHTVSGARAVTSSPVGWGIHS